MTTKYKPVTITAERKADENHAPILLRIPDSIRTKLSKVAAEKGLSRSAFIKAFIYKSVGEEMPTKPAPKAKAPKAKKEAKPKTGLAKKLAKGKAKAKAPTVRKSPIKVVSGEEPAPAPVASPVDAALNP